MKSCDIETNQENTPQEVDEVYRGAIKNALGCEPEEFAKAYKNYKKAEAKFKDLYDPFKKNLLGLYKEISEFPKSIYVSDIKLTYVAPSTRKTIDGKKLKEEEPEVAEKYTKSTNVEATLRLDEIFYR